LEDIHSGHPGLAGVNWALDADTLDALVNRETQ
jgi:hypothetical protein